jgi:hypothetical protein
VLNTATYLLNQRPCRAIGTATPHELQLGIAPTYNHLRVFGCLCFPNLTAQSANKLSPRSAPCAFLGYLPDHKGYRCFDLASRKVSLRAMWCSTRLSFHSLPFRSPPTRAPRSRLVLLRQTLHRSTLTSGLYSTITQTVHRHPSVPCAPPWSSLWRQPLHHHRPLCHLLLLLHQPHPR